jgi:hypothetical protein
MSNDLAIATVTATFRYVILESVASLGATVTNNQPGSEAAGPPDARVNIFLHQALPNAQFRNNDLPTRDAGGSLVARPGYAANLRYLVTFYGDSTKLVPQLLMGRTLVALQSRSVFTPELLRWAIAAETAVDLRASDLPDQRVLVTVRPTPLNYDDLYRLWSVFTSTPYSLSCHYEAGPVLIEERVQPVVPVPVATPQITVGLSTPIRIDAISYPFPADSAGREAGMRLMGAGFTRTGLLVRFSAAAGRFDVRPSLAQIASDMIELSPADLSALRCGLVTVQIVRMTAGEPSLPTAQSNALVLTVHPVMSELRQNDAQVVAETAVAIEPDQSVTLNLRAQGKNLSYSLAPLPAGLWPRTSIAFALAVDGQTVEPGDYLAFLTIDGASSGFDSPAHAITIRATKVAGQP